MPASKNTTRCGSRTLVAKTCGGCKELKLSSEFKKLHVKNHSYWDSHCRGCHYKSSKETTRRTNEKSLEKATHHLDIWTSDELATLWRLDRQGLSHRQIGERLGRTQLAVQIMKARTRVIANGVKLCYFDSRNGTVRVVGKPFDPEVKGHEGRLHKAAQELSELHPQLIFFIDIEGGGEYMGIRGLDALKEGDDREPEDTSEDLEVLTHPSQNEN